VSTRQPAVCRPGAAGLALLGAACVPLPAAAWVLNLATAPKQLYLAVGVSTAGAANPAINLVSVAVPAASLGNGAPQPMTSDSTQAASPYDGYTVCVPPAQVYIGASYRQPGTTTGAATATLQVTAPSNLSNGATTIPVSQISWTSSALGNAAADIPAGTFTGSTQFLANIARNTWVENCFTYSYANTAFVAAGIYTARAVFTLLVP
jgi:hypothetical protein